MRRLSRSTSSSPTATRCSSYNSRVLNFLPDKTVIIVAGGSGSRMKTDLPKQFLLLDGIPVILQTIQVFLRFDPDIELVVVLPEDYFNQWRELCVKFNVTKEHKLAVGGATRSQSVINALALVDDDRVVAIHDAVRPLVSVKTIDKGFRDALTFGNAIPAIPISDSIRWSEGKNNRAIERENLRIIQTPQVFDAALIKRAYRRLGKVDFSDDASVLEAMGESIHLFEGDRENIKITYPSDLLFAEAILKS